VTFRQVGIEEGRRLADEGYRVIDVRERVEWDAGHIGGALLIPLGELASRAATELPDRDAPLLIHCRSGARSERASAWLAAQGYSNVVNLRALVADWQKAGGAWEEPAKALTPAQSRRYARQVLIPDVGEAGQRRLLEAKVLVVGAGGLGSPAALYLAAAGIGTLGLVDDDVVEESNLQRQVLHATEAIGMAKVDSAQATLRRMNPETRVIAHRERLEAGNVERLIAPYDVIVDGTDSIDTRYVLNDAAVALRRPVVHAAVYRWEGQVTTFVPLEGPCYRCLHPVQPPQELVPACDVAGVLGVLPGIAGMLQATEALKLVLGVGDTLVGRLLTFDGRRGTFEEIRIPRDPACPACGQAAASAQMGTAAATP